MHPVLAGRGIFDPKEEDVSNTSGIGRAEPHEPVTLVGNGMSLVAQAGDQP
jgi:hypothetical protein